MSARYRSAHDVGAFEKTVEANVTPLLTNQTITFVRLGNTATTASTVAEVTGAEGKKVSIEYTMSREPGGSWKINDFRRTDMKDTDVWNSSQESNVKLVVTDQAKAIKSGDFENAYDTFMSSRYKAEHDGPAFAKTVEANVNPLLHNRTLTFRRVGGNETRAQVVADVVDQRGSRVTIEYMLVKEPDGSWKIDDFKRTEYKPLP